jgi:hypothetical protein
VGNYSKNPQTALQDAVRKGYRSVRFQQGKPILDRELNLAADLADPRRLLQQFLGDGVLEDDGEVEGFHIDNVDALGNDFTIRAGRCLVNGYEVMLNSDTTYKNQPHREHVAPLPKSDHSLIYLHVFIVEVNETQDADLHNSGDIGFETALRERVDWEVVVTGQGLFGPEYFPLASLSITGSEGPPSPGSASPATTSAVAVGASTSVVPPPDDPPVVTLRDLRVQGLSLPSLKGTLDFIMDPSHTSLRDGIVGTRQITDGAVNGNKIAASSVRLGHLSTTVVAGFIATVGPSQTANFVIVDKSLVGFGPWILVSISGTGQFSWNERSINNDRILTITNLSSTAQAAVNVTVLKLTL